MNAQTTIPANFANGCGLAHRSFRDNPRCIAMMTDLLGSPMIGTFNLQASPADVRAVRGMAPTRMLTVGDDTAICHLCGLTNGDGDEWPVFMYQWTNAKLPNRRPPAATIELISRAPIPDSFRTGDLRLAVYRPFTADERNAWVRQQRYWFQTFPWGPASCRGRKNADSALQWHTIAPHVEWSGLTVLDIGGNAGYHCFEAAKRGAVVTLVEVPSALSVARNIGNHIECQDIRYLATDPGDEFDVILYLSVHHQLDGTYKTLPDTIARLKSRCRKLFVELIDPVEGARGVHRVQTDYSLSDVNEIMGGNPLLTYRHNVRGVRHIWAVVGDIGRRAA